MENPIKMDDLGVALFLETPIYDEYILILYVQKVRCEQLWHLATFRV